ncbi:transposase [Sphingobium ummariense]|uniref:transposase n=1 Tax=Sphingobium ummariense TaxID=420994 RepID=UPI000A04E960
MSVPGVGPITALTYTSTIEDPHCFARSDNVGAYHYLQPTRKGLARRVRQTLAWMRPALLAITTIGAGKDCNHPMAREQGPPTLS